MGRANGFKPVRRCLGGGAAGTHRCHIGVKNYAQVEICAICMEMNGNGVQKNFNFS